MDIESFETSGGEVYDAAAWTISRWATIGLIAANEKERLAFPWAAITKITLEDAP